MIYKNHEISTYILTLYTFHTVLNILFKYYIFKIIQYFFNSDDIDGKTCFRITRKMYYILVPVYALSYQLFIVIFLYKRINYNS